MCIRDRPIRLSAVTSAYLAVCFPPSISLDHFLSLSHFSLLIYLLYLSLPLAVYLTLLSHLSPSLPCAFSLSSLLSLFLWRLGCVRCLVLVSNKTFYRPKALLFYYWRDLFQRQNGGWGVLGTYRLRHSWLTIWKWRRKDENTPLNFPRLTFTFKWCGCSLIIHGSRSPTSGRSLFDEVLWSLSFDALAK